MSVTEAEIEAVLRREIRLVSGPIPDDCPCNGGCDCDRTWRVKPGNIEQCAKAIVALIAASKADPVREIRT